MASQGNINAKKFSDWDELKGKTYEESLAIIYDRTSQKSQEMCDWYWRSIKKKKRFSIYARILSVIFLIVGTILPILSAVHDEAARKLAFTQYGVAMLVVAGLITLSDKIFGWSSGWMRYIQTVTSMENLISIYQMEWGNYLVMRTKDLDSGDVKTLFDLTIALQNELIKLLSEETNKWIAEFNASISLLESTIKSQREETEKKLDAIRTNLSDQSKAAETKEEANEDGSIEVTFSYKEKPIKLKLELDNTEPTEFQGYSWAKLGIKPGQHILNIKIMSNPPQEIKKILNVKPSSVTELEVKIETSG